MAAHAKQHGLLGQPAASRNSGETSTRPGAVHLHVHGVAQEDALPPLADMGSLAMRSRNFSHSGRGNTIRQPSGCFGDGQLAAGLLEGRHDAGSAQIAALGIETQR